MLVRVPRVPRVPASRVAVCFDATVARALADAGWMVVLCGTDADALGRAAHQLRTPGRVSVLVGDPASDTDLAAASVMAAELFGAEPVVVTSTEQAHRLRDAARDIVAPIG